MPASPLDVGACSHVSPRQPLALLEQWKDEIEEKCVPHLFNILIYHGDGKKGIKNVSQLEKYDIVSIRSARVSALLD